MNKVQWNKPLWDMHNGIPKSVPVILPDGRMQENVYRVVCQYEAQLSSSRNAVLVHMPSGFMITNKMVYPIAQTAEGFIVCVYSYDNTRYGMVIVNLGCAVEFVGWYDEDRREFINVLDDGLERISKPGIEEVE